MKIDRKQLLSALNAVMPGTQEKEQVALSSFFIFMGDRVVTYNDEISVSHPIDVGFEGAVPAKAFKALISKGSGETVSLVVKGGELLLESSKAKAGLRIEMDATTPLEQIGMPTDWIDLPDKFCEAVKFCLFSASKDEKKVVLMNIHVKGQYVESSDNYRITSYDMGDDAADAFPESILIPVGAAKEITAHSPIEYAVTDGWLHFRNDDDVTFSCRYFDDTFPDFSSFLECEGDEFVFPPTLPEMLDRAGVLGDGERVSIILENNELVVTTENESGWFEESVDVKYNGTPSEFDIQPEFMKAIMKFKGTAVIGDRALRFDSDDFIHVCMILTPKKK